VPGSAANVRWGLGDVAIGLLVALVVGQVVTGIVFGIQGYEDSDDVPLTVVPLLQVAL
jgi:hypothetical protein